MLEGVEPKPEPMGDRHSAGWRGIASAWALVRDASICSSMAFTAAVMAVGYRESQLPSTLDSVPAQ